MIRIGPLLWLALVALASIGTFQLKYRVQAQDGDVRRDHACEECCDHRDPEDTPRDPALAPNRARSRTRRNSNSFLGSGGGPGGH